MSDRESEPEYEVVFESENEPDEPESEPEPESQQPVRKKYQSTKGDADKRKAQCLLNLAKAREAKAKKAQAKKALEAQQFTVQQSESESEDSDSESPEEYFSKLKNEIQNNIVSRYSKDSAPITFTKAKGTSGMKASKRKQSGSGAKKNDNDNDRLDRLESIMERIEKSKAKSKSKPKVVKNTIVQMPPYPIAQPNPQTPQVAQAKRQLFHDLGL